MQKIKTAESLMVVTHTHTHTHTQVYLNNLKNNFKIINETRLNL